VRHEGRAQSSRCLLGSLAFERNLQDEGDWIGEFPPWLGTGRGYDQHLLALIGDVGALFDKPFPEQELRRLR
jgi:hypothetical protein